jgi:hypothetical protein
MKRRFKEHDENTLNQHFWKGGEANKKDQKVFNAKDLEKGIKVEYEHTLGKSEEDRKIAKKIAQDHLAEHPKYYDALADMEQELEI